MPPKPRRYALVQDYLDSNREQGSALGARVGGQLAAGGAAAGDALAGVQGAFDDAAAAGAQAFTPELQQQLQADPASLVGNAQYAKARSGAYTGPQALSDTTGYTDALGQVREAQAQSALAGSEAGRGVLVQGLGGRQTAGGTALDAGLLGREQGALGAGAARGNALGGELVSAQGVARDRAAQGVRDAATAREQVLGAEGELERSTLAGIDSRLAGERARQERVRGALSAGGALQAGDLEGLGLTAADIADLRADAGTTTRATLDRLSQVQKGVKRGAERNRYTRFYQGGPLRAGEQKAGEKWLKQHRDPIRFDASSYLSTPTLQRESVATAGDRARLSALEQLSGRAAPTLGAVQNAPTLSYNVQGARARQANALAAAKRERDWEDAFNRRSGGNTFIKNVGQGIKANPLGAALSFGVAPVVGAVARKPTPLNMAIGSALALPGAALRRR